VTKRRVARCPECGTRLLKGRYTDTWDPSGRPDEVYWDWYCPKCKYRWMPLRQEPEEEKPA